MHLARLKHFAPILTTALVAVVALPGARAEVKFTSDTKAALSQAAKGRKLVMVDVYTDWCGWCKKLDKDVYARPDVTDAVKKNFVALKVNPEKSKANADFVKKYGVRGFPTIIFLDSKGKEVHRIVGYREHANFMKEMNTAVTKSKAKS